MSGPHRNPDRINTIGVVVVGICGAVLVYVTIVALEAFYVNDTSEIQTMADYGGQDTTAKSVRAEQQQHINEYGPNNAVAGSQQTYRIKIDDAMKKVVDEAKVDPSQLIPSVGRSDISTIKPVFGRPKIEAPPATPAPGGATPPANGAAPPAGEGSAAVKQPVDVPMSPTGTAGAKTEPAPVPGAGPTTPPGAGKQPGKAGTGTPPKQPATPATPAAPKQPKAAGSGSGGHAP